MRAEPSTGIPQPSYAEAETAVPEARSHGALIWLRFKKHRMATVSLGVLAVLAVLGLFAEFFIPNSPFEQFKGYNYAPPRPLRFVAADGSFHLVPFIYDYEKKLDPETFLQAWTEIEERRYHLRLFVRGFEYRLLGLIPADLHLFGLEEGAPPLLLFGSDRISRDLFSRTIFATRVSISVALFGVFIVIVIGVSLGAISGYFGGLVDDAIQRVSELLLAVPKLPLWLALAAAVPRDMPTMERYVLIVIIASLTSWPGVARGVRSKLISLRSEDFVLAARSYGSSDRRIIFRYLVPNFTSYIIVAISLGIPAMILFETSLSFLGIGLQSPAISWGVLLEQAQSYTNVIFNPWLMIPGVFVVVAILAFNFVGDGIRDAADPYEKLT